MTSESTKDKQERRNRVKKSETLEVRIPHETKQAFLAACREDGTTASEVVRESVQSCLDKRERPDPKKESTLVMTLPRPMRRYGLRIAASGLAAVGLATFATLPGAAAPDLAAAFRKLDANSDGVLTDAEFGKRESLGVKEMGLRIPRRTPSEPKVDSTEAPIFLIPAPTDGKPASELMRDVRLQGFGIPPASLDRAAASFAAFDANKNGAVDMEEFLARQKLMLANGFAVLDKDGDGGLDAGEYAGLGTSLILYPTDAILELGVAAKYGTLVWAKTLEAEFEKNDAYRVGKVSLQ